MEMQYIKPVNEHALIFGNYSFWNEDNASASTIVRNQKLQIKAILPSFVALKTLLHSPTSGYIIKFCVAEIRVKNRSPIESDTRPDVTERDWCLADETFYKLHSAQPKKRYFYHISCPASKLFSRSYRTANRRLYRVTKLSKIIPSVFWILIFFTHWFSSNCEVRVTKYRPKTSHLTDCDYSELSSHK